MGAVSSLFVRKVLKAAGDEIDQVTFLESIGLQADAESDVAHRVSDTAYYDLLERIADIAADATDLPLKAGASMQCNDYGALGLAWKAAPNLRESIARLERYWQLWTSVSQYELRPEGSAAYFILHRAGERRLGLRLSNEATLASATSIIREVSTVDFAPLEVHCKHRPPNKISAHEDYFGCPVIFESELDALLISSDHLSRPNRLGDVGITKFLISHLDQEIQKHEREQSLVDEVRDAIVRLLSSGVPRASAVAHQLGLSERSLQRRLKDEDISYTEIMEEVRRKLAEGLLVQSDYSLAEVAYLSGFSEQSAFNRAFKRWKNQTPATYRESNREPF
ncbi:MAG: AraC family transcriptional regulator [Rhodospirillaceae bacterium]